MRKIISVLLVVAIAAFIFAPAALAAESTLDQFIKKVDALNTQIEKKVAAATEQADKFVAQGKSEQVDRVIANLLKWIDTKAEVIIEKAAKYGIEIYCVDTPYVIGGKTVLIDPLIIGGL
jgi:predicted PurR-regulated permease PerM